MRRILLLLLLPSLCGLLTSCGISEEDRDFYYRGWLFPTELDRHPPSRLRKQPSPAGMPQYKKDPLID